MTSILIIDDDRDFCEMMSRVLSQEGFEVEHCVDPERGLAEIGSKQFDIVLLDIMMPKMDGLSVLRSLRSKSDVHVIMLTAKGDDVDRIVGLELGADDYLPKPFNSRELIARIRALLRRTRPASQERVLEVGDIELNDETRSVFRRGEPIDLTTSEFDLLKILLENAGNVVGREDLAKILGRNLGVFDRAIDMHVSNLRRKLGVLSDGTARIRTVRNAGYLYARARARRKR